MLHPPGAGRRVGDDQVDRLYSALRRYSLVTGQHRVDAAGEVVGVAEAHRVRLPTRTAHVVLAVDD